MHVLIDKAPFVCVCGEQVGFQPSPPTRFSSMIDDENELWQGFD